MRDIETFRNKKIVIILQSVFKSTLRNTQKHTNYSMGVL